MIRRVSAAFAAKSVLAEQRQVRVTVSTEMLGRDDLVLKSGGVDLRHYRRNPIILWQHNPDWPIARALTIDVVGTDLVALAQFPRAGASARSDEIYELIREGVINAASSGFEIIEAGPTDPGNPKSGTTIKRCELQEFSFVSIPAVPDALISERARRAKSQPSMRSYRRMAALYADELKRDRRPAAIDMAQVARRARAARYRRELARPGR